MGNLDRWDACRRVGVEDEKTPMDEGAGHLVGTERFEVRHPDPRSHDRTTLANVDEPEEELPRRFSVGSIEVIEYRLGSHCKRSRDATDLVVVCDGDRVAGTHPEQFRHAVLEKGQRAGSVLDTSHDAFRDGSFDVHADPLCRPVHGLGKLLGTRRGQHDHPGLEDPTEPRELQRLAEEVGAKGDGHVDIVEISCPCDQVEEATGNRHIRHREDLFELVDKQDEVGTGGQRCCDVVQRRLAFDSEEVPRLRRHRHGDLLERSLEFLERLSSRIHSRDDPVLRSRQSTGTQRREETGTYDGGLPHPRRSDDSDNATVFQGGEELCYYAGSSEEVAGVGLDERRESLVRVPGRRVPMLGRSTQVREQHLEERGDGWEPIGRILTQGLHDGGDVGLDREVDRGVPTGEEFVGENTEGVHVACRRRPTVPHGLGDDVRGELQGGRVDVLFDRKPEEVGVPGFVEHDAVRSHRAVDDSERVSVRQAVPDLSQNAFRISVGDVEESATMEPVRHVGTLAVPPVVERRADVGIIHDRESLCVRLEVANEPGVGGSLPIDHLEQYLPADRRLVRQIERSDGSGSHRVP